MKRRIIISLAVATIILLVAAVSFVRFGGVLASDSANLIAYYSFDSGAVDESGNGHDGTVNGAVLVEGKFGQAYQFDGVDDYIEVPDSNDLDVGTNDFSVSVWFRHDQADATSWDEGIVSKLNYVGSEYYGFYVGMDGNAYPENVRNRLNFNIGSTNNPYGEFIRSQITYNDGLWHHVVVVADRDLGLSIYVDGNFHGFVSENKAADLSNERPLWIGRSLWSFFYGSIDELAIYDKALNSSEVKALFNDDHKLPDSRFDSWTKVEYSSAPASYGGILNRIFAQPYDMPAMESAYLQPLENENLSFIDSQLDMLFGDYMDYYSDEQKSVMIMDYLSQVLYIKDVGSTITGHNGYSAFLIDRPNCYWKSLAFTAMCRRAGVPARVVSLDGSGDGDHSVAEAYFTGDWHQFDTYFASFFYSKDEYDGAGNIVSVNEIRTSTSTSNFYAMRTDGEQGTGTYASSSNIILMPANEYYGDTLKAEVMLNLLTKSFPVDIRQSSRSFSGIVDFDLNQGDDLWIGSIDGDMWDMAARQGKNTFATFIGNWREQGLVNTILLTNNEPGMYRLTYHFLRDDVVFRPGVAELKGVVVKDIVNQLGSWQIDFYVQEDNAILLLDLLYNSNEPTFAVLDAMHLEKL